MDGPVKYGAADLYWGRCGRYVAVDLSWGRCGRKWGDRSLLGTEWKGMVLLIPTGDNAEEDDTVYLYRGRCGRIWR